MVTYSSPSHTEAKVQYDFEGLSTDTKPTATDFPNMGNGSSFLEMDTKVLFFYDENSGNWV